MPRTVHRGDRVPVTLHAVHEGGAPRELYTRGRAPTCDVTVRDAAGRVAWRLLEGTPVPAIVRLATLAPGERLALHATWPVDVAPGAYLVTGALLLEDTELASDPAPVTVAA